MHSNLYFFYHLNLSHPLLPASRVTALLLLLTHSYTLLSRLGHPIVPPENAFIRCYPLNDITIIPMTPLHSNLLVSKRSIFYKRGRTNAWHLQSTTTGSTTDDGMPTDENWFSNMVMHDALRRRRFRPFANSNSRCEAVGINGILLSRAPFACT